MQPAAGASPVRTIAETGSTNDDLLALARAGAAEGQWLRAERQTGGKGRQGRSWQSPAGNLHASTLVRLRPGDPPAPSLALVAAVALHETLSHYRHPRESGELDSLLGTRGEKLDPRFRGADRLDCATVKIKWPNDLMAGPAKLGGILLERADDAVVIGFGANLAHAPDLPDRPTVSLAALTGVAPDPEVVAEMLADAFARWLGRWRGEGLARIRAAWLAAAHPVGTALSTGVGEGLFDGLDGSGSLRLRLADGSSHVIHAGDVFLI